MDRWIFWIASALIALPSWPASIYFFSEYHLGNALYAEFDTPLYSFMSKQTRGTREYYLRKDELIRSLTYKPPTTLMPLKLQRELEELFDPLSDDLEIKIGVTRCYQPKNKIIKANMSGPSSNSPFIPFYISICHNTETKDLKPILDQMISIEENLIFLRKKIQIHSPNPEKKCSLPLGKLNHSLKKIKLWVETNPQGWIGLPPNLILEDCELSGSYLSFRQKTWGKKINDSTSMVPVFHLGFYLESLTRN